MKKIFLSIALALATTVCTAQSVNDVIREFKSAKGATCLNLNKSMIKLMGEGKEQLSLPENIKLGDLGEVGKDIDSVKIFLLNTRCTIFKHKYFS